MRFLSVVLTVLFLPVLAFAQPETSTAAPGLEDVIGSVPAVVEAFQNGGILAGVAAIFGVLGVAVNFGPLKVWLDASKFDWVRPLVMLIGGGLTAALAAVAGGAGAVPATIAAVIAGAGSGFLQKFIQEIRD